ncbi:TPA: hypothetical protein JBB11_15560 [Legionella pneumophila subsp. pneumophila]|nr:hypothetical protein [Legionella pneumophila subsp. pneumophila]HAT8869585.1 hypothetical protein [Legionella pneumophila subsp. pneumophila]HAT8891319.1 hypothetical protein [Legionella pneumophila subsp. pneumophila]HAT8934677.1 hypothetical protein [Legionella pneumophila subsp. pneumophila]
MFLTFANGCIIVLGLVLTWCILFSIFDEKSSRRLGIKLGILGSCGITTKSVNSELNRLPICNLQRWKFNP